MKSGGEEEEVLFLADSATAEVTADTDTLRRLLSGEQPLRSAVDRGQAKVAGDRVIEAFINCFDFK